MSIPDRFLRIARYKLNDLKDWFERVDEEREARTAEEERRRARSDQRQQAQRELDDAIASLQAPASGKREEEKGGAAPYYPPAQSPIPAAQRGGAGNNGVAPSQNSSSAAPSTDPLAYHYRLLGLEPGADLNAVQTAYNSFAARCDPSRFPTGSSDQAQALQIRQKLDESYKVLRDTLDATVRRFDLLEF